MQDLEFAKRLAQACADHAAVVPAAGQGRLVTLSKSLGVSQEAVRRWFAGESRPRVVMMGKLATFLNCDEGWLSLGIGPQMTPAERRLFDRAQSGASHLALGLAMCEGAHCSEPDAKDPRRTYVDFYMIRSGRQTPIHASFGREAKPGEFVFTIPREFDEVTNVGLIKPQGSSLMFLELDASLIARHKEQDGGQFSITVKRDKNVFRTGRDTWKSIKSFADLS